MDIPLFKKDMKSSNKGIIITFHTHVSEILFMSVVWGYLKAQTQEVNELLLMCNKCCLSKRQNKCKEWGWYIVVILDKNIFFKFIF